MRFVSSSLSLALLALMTGLGRPAHADRLPPPRPPEFGRFLDIEESEPPEAVSRTDALPTSEPEKPAPPPAPPPPPVVAAAPPERPVASAPAPLTEKAALERANAYFNGIAGLTGDFIQTGGDGRRFEGKIYLFRPGRLRFEYKNPSTLEVIADGRSVAVRDRKLATQDLYSISQTPLKFLLRDRIDLARDVRITRIAIDPDAVRLSLEDSSTLGGTSKIMLQFDGRMESLKRWRILDPQGAETTVLLTNLDRVASLDAKLFFINYERVLEDRR